jgi:DNA-binding TFAR19-related protein (PDSD5 family)
MQYRRGGMQMGFFGILKANFGSIKKQREIEEAIQSEDNEKVKILIAESISSILRSGLTKKQLNELELIKNDYGESLSQLLSQAFQNGWMRSGTPNLSNALDEVLRRAQEIIKEYRPLNG